MKIGIMQPYLFPYLGYFQLINAVDQFVIYDDVNYIRQGYINRNTILMGNSPQRFTVAVPGAS
ncbi:WbqC family protein, partial [Citrobacter koseri]